MTERAAGAVDEAGGLVGPEPDPIVAAPVAVSVARPFVGPIPLGLVYVALGALCFSVMSLLVKLASARLPNAEIVAARSVVTLVLSWGTLRLARKPAWGNRHGLLILRGVIGFLGLYGFYHSVVHMPLADATVIQNTNPIFAVLLAAWLLREGLRGRELFSMGVSLVGVLLIARPAFLFGHGEAPTTLSVLVGLGGAVCSATAYVLVRQLRATEAPLVIVYYFALMSVVCAVPIAIVSGLLWPTPLEWLILVGVGVTTQLGQVFLTRGLHLERAGLATTVAYLQIVFAIGWGWLFFAEAPDSATWAGAALVVGSAVALLRPAKDER